MPEESEREALVAGIHNGIIWAIPHLLRRAGFSVDVIATSPLMRSSKFVRTMRHVCTVEELAQTVFEQIGAGDRRYDWVVAGDDLTLNFLVNLPWPGGRRPAYLSVEPAGEIDHICSKIGLSRALAAAGLQTPPFHVAGDWREAAAWARLHGYPVLLKIDNSGGGEGVYECRYEAEIERRKMVFKEPVLVQKKIAGREIDLSSIYLDHQLVHFAYGQVVRSERKFGPSVVRTYYPLPLVDTDIFAELARLGSALRANGFTTTKCIEADDGSGRYYFEADLRPNAWSDCSTLFGDDPAVRIRRWFDSHSHLTPQSVARQGAFAPVVIPCFHRMPAWELLVNRYRVWRYVPFADTRVVLRLLLRASFVRSVKAILPRQVERKLRAWRSLLRSRPTAA